MKVKKTNRKKNNKSKDKNNKKENENYKLNINIIEENLEIKPNKLDIKDYKLYKDFISHNGEIECITELEPGYLASCGKDQKIIIYKPETYETLLEILDDCIINYIIYSKNKNLISASDKHIKIYLINLSKKKYDLLQEINTKEDILLYKVIELSNENIASCSFEGKINIYIL